MFACTLALGIQQANLPDAWLSHWASRVASCRLNQNMWTPVKYISCYMITGTLVDYEICIVFIIRYNNQAWPGFCVYLCYYLPPGTYENVIHVCNHDKFITPLHLSNYFLVFHQMSWILLCAGLKPAYFLYCFRAVDWWSWETSHSKSGIRPRLKKYDEVPYQE